jgi:hypothetical protein
MLIDLAMIENAPTGAVDTSARSSRVPSPSAPLAGIAGWRRVTSHKNQYNGVLP